MFLILTYGEYDSQSSRKAWEVWYPYLTKGFATHKEAEDRIAQDGYMGVRFFIVETRQPVTPCHTTAVILADEKVDAGEGDREVLAVEELDDDTLAAIAATEAPVGIEEGES